MSARSLTYSAKQRPSKLTTVSQRMTSWKVGDGVRRLCTAEGLEISIAWSRTDLTLLDILPGDMDHRCRTGNSRGEEQDEGNEEGKELHDRKVSTAKHPSA
jgi:hypothetical protein